MKQGAQPAPPLSEAERASIRAIADVVKERESGAIGFDEAIRRIGEIVAADDARRVRENTCAMCGKPATDSLDFSGCRHNGVELGREPLCGDCLCGLIEGATRGDMAVQIFKRRGIW